MSRIDALRVIAEVHPEMPLHDALTATAHHHDVVEVVQTIRYDERNTWRLYAACALQGLVGGEQSASHVTEQAAHIADAMILLETKRFEGTP